MFIKNLNLEKKRVFLRADLNVPIENNKIIQDYRLESILPTIDYIQKQGGKVVLTTHIGRPTPGNKANFFDANFSTKILADWLKDKGYSVDHEVDLLQAIEKSKEDFDQILLLENLRFFHGEKEVDYEFAQLLAQLADVYVNDAFGIIHRTDTSVTLLAEQFDAQNRAFGLLIEKEIEELTKLKENPEQPFVIALGGSKVKTKIKVLEQFLEQQDSRRVKTILTNGLIAQALKSTGFLEKAKDYNVNVITPVDVCVTSETLDQPATVYDANKIPEDKVIVDIGPKTIEMFKKEIGQAKTIFASGTMGMYEKAEYANGSREILQAIADSDAYSVVGGGDVVAAAHLFDLEKNMNFLSTGGGATLAFLASKNPQEELAALKICCITSNDYTTLAP